MGPKPSSELPTIEATDPIIHFQCEDCDDCYATWNLSDAMEDAVNYHPSIQEGRCCWCSDHEPSGIQSEGLIHPGRRHGESSPFNNCSLKCVECNKCYARFNEGIGHIKGFDGDSNIHWAVGYCSECEGSWSQQSRFNGLTKAEIKRAYNDELNWKKACKAAEIFSNNTSSGKVSAYIVFDNTRSFNSRCGGLNSQFDKNHRKYGKYTIAKFEADHRKNGTTFSADMDGSLSSIFDDIKNSSSSSYIAYQTGGKAHVFYSHYGDEYQFQKKNGKCALSLV